MHALQQSTKTFCIQSKKRIPLPRLLEKDHHTERPIGLTNNQGNEINFSNLDAVLCFWPEIIPDNHVFAVKPVKWS